MELLIGVFVFLMLLLLIAIVREERATARLDKTTKAFVAHYDEITTVINDNAEVVSKLIGKLNETIMNNAFMEARVDIIYDALGIAAVPKEAIDDIISKLKNPKNLESEIS